MDDKRRCAAARRTLTNQATIETQLIRLRHASTEHSRLAVDGNAAGANPVLCLATRCEASTRQHLLQALALGIGTGTATAPGSGRSATRAKRCWTNSRATAARGCIIALVARILVVRVILIVIDPGTLEV
jgi:hypothetical protein